MVGWVVPIHRLSKSAAQEVSQITGPTGALLAKEFIW